jgi:hypothetical protein
VIDRSALFARLGASVDETDPDAPIDVGRLVRRWLDAGPAVFAGADRADLDALCRQIDVRRRISRGYDAGWGRRDPEEPVAPATVAGAVAVLLANAGPLNPGSVVDDGGWGLKCVNSALKALDQYDAVPEAPTLRAWALAVLDARTGNRS